MAADRKYVNIEDKPDLAAVARDVRDSGESVVLREAGHQFAVISPISEHEPDERTAQDRRDRIMAHAGSPKRLIDDDFLEENDRQRGNLSRQPQSNDF